MSRIQQNDNFPAEFNKLKNKVSILERMIRVLSSLTEINTTGLSNTQIDEQIIAAGYSPPNGKSISDPTNKLFLVRQNNEWKKVELK